MLVSTTFSAQDFNLTSSPPQVQCRPQNALWAFGWMFIPILEVLLNSFFIFVTYRSKEKLRHNYVYAYVINVFAGNLLLGIATIYNLLNFVFVFERYWGTTDPYKVDHTAEGHENLQLWWSFQRAFTVSLYLTNNANVSALIYGIRDSAHFVGRNASITKKHKDRMATLRKRKSKALAIITFSWLFPMGFTIAGMFTNCIRHCLCVYANYDPSVNYCQTDVNKECSRIWMPLTHNFLLGIVITWSLEVVFNLFMLVGTYQRSRRAMRPRPPRRSGSLTASISDLGFQSVSSPPGLYSGTYQQEKYEFDPKIIEEDMGVAPMRKPPYFNTTLKLLFVISFTFFITSLPIMVVVFVDVISVDFVILRYSVTAALAISFLYPLAVPFILFYYMPTLRSATHNAIFSLKCCTKTTTVQPRKNSVKTVS